jgi:hypothetical protein
VYEFDYTAVVPAAGNGGCYRVKGAGQAINYLWQAVTISPGHQYTLNGAYKYIADTAVNVLVEYFLTRVKPTGDEVVTGQGWSLNTWMEPDIVNLDGTFEDNFVASGLTAALVFIPDTVTQTEWYVVLKAGCWTIQGETEPIFDLLFDELVMTDRGFPTGTVLPIEKIIFGSVDSPEDYTGQVSLRWDVDSFYMVFDVVDDIIVNSGAAHQVDNIEIYLDMDNSKNIHWPRNGGWEKPIDDAYDDNDFQLRLVPDMPFAANNTAKPGIACSDTAVRQVYTRTADGYQFVLNIAWDALMAGFEANEDAVIGFDILLSDNDAFASDENRNQITWNSPSMYLFNDPSLFGVLDFSAGGTFLKIPDKEGPSDPSGVLAIADGYNITLTWIAATDNRVVQNYILYKNYIAIFTVLAEQTGNRYEFYGMTPDNYTFSVVAVDPYQNKSGRANSNNVTVVSGIEDPTGSGIMVYPNPSGTVFHIASEGNASVSVEVYNMTGVLVNSSVFIGNYILDLSGKNKGVYLMQLTQGGKTSVMKLIVQ